MPVAVFIRTGIGGRLPIVAVRVVRNIPTWLAALVIRTQRVTEPIGVGVGVPGAGIHCRVLIGDTVTVIIVTVAVLVGPWIGVAILVVAIRVILNVACRLSALDIGHGGVAKPVRVGVGIPSRGVNGGVLINTAVAVIVMTIAILVRTGVGGGLRVIAVGVVGDVAAGLVAVDVRDRGVSKTI